MARMLLQGDALRIFENKAANVGNEMNEHFLQVMQMVTKHVFPWQALVRQKHCMHCMMQKPRTMKVREFGTRVVEMNDQFSFYPPFLMENRLPDDELANIVEAAMPQQWQRSMLIQGFDVADHTFDELIEFAERMEMVEDLYEATTNGQNGAMLKVDETRGSKKGGNKRFARSSDEDKTTNKSKNAAKNGWKKRKADGMWCKLHEATTPNTKDCKVLQKQIANMRSTWNAQHSSVKSRRTSYSSSPKIVNEPSRRCTRCSQNSWTRIAQARPKTINNVRVNRNIKTLTTCLMTMKT